MNNDVEKINKEKFEKDLHIAGYKVFLAFLNKQPEIRKIYEEELRQQGIDPKKILG
ncbi:MAG: hypothetical protein FWB83_07200 [Treponema sp.]|nr:hypothetical protein [Treponema sp.]